MKFQGYLKALKEACDMFVKMAGQYSNHAHDMAKREIDDLFESLTNEKSSEFERIVITSIKEADNEIQALGAGINAVLEAVPFIYIGGDRLVMQINEFMRMQGYQNIEAISEIDMEETAFSANVGGGGGSQLAPDFPKKQFASVKRISRHHDGTDIGTYPKMDESEEPQWACPVCKSTDLSWTGFAQMKCNNCGWTGDEEDTLDPRLENRISEDANVAQQADKAIMSVHFTPPEEEYTKTSDGHTDVDLKVHTASQAPANIVEVGMKVWTVTGEDIDGNWKEIIVQAENVYHALNQVKAQKLLPLEIKETKLFEQDFSIGQKIRVMWDLYTGEYSEEKYEITDIQTDQQGYYKYGITLDPADGVEYFYGTALKEASDSAEKFKVTTADGIKPEIDIPQGPERAVNVTDAPEVEDELHAGVNEQKSYSYVVRVPGQRSATVSVGVPRRGGDDTGNPVVDLLGGKKPVKDKFYATSHRTGHWMGPFDTAEEAAKHSQVVKHYVGEGWGGVNEQKSYSYVVRVPGQRSATVSKSTGKLGSEVYGNLRSAFPPGVEAVPGKFYATSYRTGHFMGPFDTAEEAAVHSQVVKQYVVEDRKRVIKRNLKISEATPSVDVTTISDISVQFTGSNIEPKGGKFYGVNPDTNEVMYGPFDTETEAWQGIPAGDFVQYLESTVVEDGGDITNRETPPHREPADPRTAGEAPGTTTDPDYTRGEQPLAGQDDDPKKDDGVADTTDSGHPDDVPGNVSPAQIVTKIPEDKDLIKEEQYWVVSVKNAEAAVVRAENEDKAFDKYREHYQYSGDPYMVWPATNADVEEYRAMGDDWVLENKQKSFEEDLMDFVGGVPIEKLLLQEEAKQKLADEYLIEYGSNSSEGQVNELTTTPGLKNALTKVGGSDVSCAACSYNLPKYPGKYPKVCPNCKTVMTKPKTLELKPSDEETKIDEQGDHFGVEDSRESSVRAMLDGTGIEYESDSNAGITYFYFGSEQDAKKAYNKVSSHMNIDEKKKSGRLMEELGVDSLINSAKPVDDIGKPNS